MEFREMSLLEYRISSAWKAIDRYNPSYDWVGIAPFMRLWDNRRNAIQYIRDSPDSPCTLFTSQLTPMKGVSLHRIPGRRQKSRSSAPPTIPIKKNRQILKNFIKEGGTHSPGRGYEISWSVANSAMGRGTATVRKPSISVSG